MDIKNREMQRINKENSILMKFMQQRIEDRALKRQVMKACKKIQKAFRGVVDDGTTGDQCASAQNELERDIQKSELHTNQVHSTMDGSSQLTRKALLGLTSKSKLIEAAFKEKDLDAYFSLGIVL